MRKIILFSVLILCYACQQKEKDIFLFGNTPLVVSKPNTKISALLGDSVKLTPLETRKESFIGRINKIKKFNGDYYVLTEDKWIHHFDTQGKYISSLERLGGGPDEYTRIEDFDVYSNHGHPEIWLCDMKKIKIYDPVDFSLIRTLSFPFIVHKFLKINESKILIMAGQENKSLKISNMEGKLIKEFLKKEIPYLLMKFVQFIPIQSKIIFQLGVSNGMIEYDPVTDNFSQGYLSQDNHLISNDEQLELFQKYAYDYLKEFKNYSYIRSFRAYNHKAFIDVASNEGKRFFTVISEKTKQTAQYMPASNHLTNDLFNTEDAEFLTTFGVAESDNSIIMYAMPSAFTGGTVNSHTIKEEDNPVLIEFFY
ncbi:MAG: 6-bladed beta-propeller [Bacteroidales bacterium]|nr:6-bladed beta-propeller [Bacteroidales bacterium]